VRLRTTTALLLALAAGLAAGCGSDDEQQGEPIPRDAATALERQLASIEDRLAVGGGACADITGGADPNTTAVESVLGSLPSDVDPDLRDALEQSFTRLFELAEQQCDEDKGQDTETEPAPPPETETDTTETEPTVTETAPEQTETLPETETETEPDEDEGLPPGQGGEPPGQGGGNPGQGGNGGVLVPEEDG
jgi:hypothetical protein